MVKISGTVPKRMVLAQGGLQVGATALRTGYPHILVNMGQGRIAVGRSGLNRGGYTGLERRQGNHPVSCDLEYPGLARPSILERSVLKTIREEEFLKWRNEIEIPPIVVGKEFEEWQVIALNEEAVPDGLNDLLDQIRLENPPWGLTQKTELPALGQGADVPTPDSPRSRDSSRLHQRFREFGEWLREKGIKIVK